MRALTLVPFLVGFLFSNANAQTAPAPDYTSACQTSWNAMAPADKAKTTYSDYLKTCSVNGPAAAPPANTVPVPAAKMTRTEKRKACEEKRVAQQKITPTGSQRKSDFLKSCMASK